MRHEFTAIYEQDGEWIIAYCPEIPGANGQGRTKVEARDSLAGAIALVLEDRRDDGLRVGQAKPYQVRQVRQLILKYALAGEVPDGDSQ